jgi:hypothetical protein
VLEDVALPKDGARSIFIERSAFTENFRYQKVVCHRLQHAFVDPLPGLLPDLVSVELKKGVRNSAVSASGFGEACDRVLE